MTDAEFIKKLAEEERLREEANAMPDCIITVIAAIIVIGIIILFFYTQILILTKITICV